MKRLVTSLTFLLFFLAPYKALSKTLTVAVIDTGVDRSSNEHLCKMGHKSFVSQDPDPLHDSHGHGTHIAGLIAKEAGPRGYCIVSIKFYSDSNTGQQNLTNMVDALNYAINIGIDYINISGGGPEFSEPEYLAIRKALSKGIKVVAAAGNERYNLDTACNYYPACYDKRIVMVGNLEKGADYTALDDTWKWLAIQAGMGDKLGTYETRRSPSSNYGKRVTRWEVGTDLQSALPGGKKGYMTGTSQATAVATGKLIKERLLK